MYAADRASREFMQIELVSCEPGCAVMRMTVRECIEFLKPAMLDDVLTCEGREQLLQGRYGVSAARWWRCFVAKAPRSRAM